MQNTCYRSPYRASIFFFFFFFFRWQTNNFQKLSLFFFLSVLHHPEGDIRGMRVCLHWTSPSSSISLSGIFKKLNFNFCSGRFTQMALFLQCTLKHTLENCKMFARNDYIWSKLKIGVKGTHLQHCFFFLDILTNCKNVIQRHNFDTNGVTGHLWVAE